MPSFSPVAYDPFSNPVIRPVEDWVVSTKFNSKNRVVDESGSRVDSHYDGRRYLLFAKLERTLTQEERVRRTCIGVALVICSLGLALFSKSVRGLFTKTKQTARYGRFLPNFNRPVSQTSSSSSSAAGSTAERPSSLPSSTMRVQRTAMELCSQSNQMSQDEINLFYPEFVKMVANCLSPAAGNSNISDEEKQQIARIIFGEAQFCEFIEKIGGFAKIRDGQDLSTHMADIVQMINTRIQDQTVRSQLEAFGRAN